MMGLSIGHFLVVAVLVVLLFGRGKISGVMGDIAQGVKAFKRGMQDDAPQPIADRRDPSDPKAQG